MSHPSSSVPPPPGSVPTRLPRPLPTAAFSRSSSTLRAPPPPPPSLQTSQTRATVVGASSTLPRASFPVPLAYPTTTNALRQPPPAPTQSYQFPTVFDKLKHDFEHQKTRLRLSSQRVELLKSELSQAYRDNEQLFNSAYFLNLLLHAAEERVERFRGVAHKIVVEQHKKSNTKEPNPDHAHWAATQVANSRLSEVNEVSLGDLLRRVRGRIVSNRQAQSQTDPEAQGQAQAQGQQQEGGGDRYVFLHNYELRVVDSDGKVVISDREDEEEEELEELEEEEEDEEEVLTTTTATTTQTEEDDEEDEEEAEGESKAKKGKANASPSSSEDGPPMKRRKLTSGGASVTKNAVPLSPSTVAMREQRARLKVVLRKPSRREDMSRQGVRKRLMRSVLKAELRQEEELRERKIRTRLLARKKKKKMVLSLGRIPRNVLPKSAASQNGPVTCLTHLRDPSSVVFASGAPGMVHLWSIGEPNDLICTRSVTVFSENHLTRDGAFSRDSTLLHVVGESPKIFTMDIERAEALSPIYTVGENMKNFCIVSREGGQELFVGGNQFSVARYDIRRRRCTRIYEGHDGGVSSLVEFGENYLVSGSVDGTIRVWDVRKEGRGAQVKLFNIESQVFALDANPYRPQFMLVGCKAGRLVFLNVITGEMTTLPNSPLEGSVYGAAHAMSGGWMVACASDPKMLFLKAPRGPVLFTHEDSTSVMDSFVYCDSNSTDVVVTGDWEGGIRRFEVVQS